MENPNFASKEYLNDGALNAAAAAIADNITALAGALSNAAGLIRADRLGFTFASLTVTIAAGPPFGVFFPQSDYELGAIFAQAHGTLTGQDSQSYALDFTSLVPGSGSVTAYAIASYAQIAQSPYQVIGPPPGHPDYDPDFVPFTAYALSTDSLVIVPTLTAANNTTTFELFRVTLTAGQTAITFVDISHPYLVTALKDQNFVAVSVNTTLVATDTGVAQKDVVGVTFTLPPASECSGLSFPIYSRASNGTTVQTQTDPLTSQPNVIFGGPTSPGIGVQSIAFQNGQAGEFYSDGVAFQVTAFAGESVATIGGTAAGFTANNPSASTSERTLTASVVILQDAFGDVIRIQNPNVTINYATTGANGIDQGSVTGGTNYYEYFIYNPTTQTVAGLASTNPTSPTLPSGFVYFAQMSWIFTNNDGTLTQNQYHGRYGHWVSQGAQVASPSLISGGPYGPGYFATNGYCSPLAIRAVVSAYLQETGSNDGLLMVHPNINFSTTPTSTNRGALTLQFSGISTGVNGQGQIDFETPGILAIYSRGSNTQVAIVAWEDPGPVGGGAGGGGGSGGVQPAIVQSTSAEALTGSPATIDFGSAPTVGNTLLFFIFTDSDSRSALKPAWFPAGVNPYFLGQYEGVYLTVATRAVQTGDGASWAFNAQLSLGVIGLEVSNCGGIDIAATNFAGVGAESTNTLTFPIAIPHVGPALAIALSFLADLDNTATPAFTGYTEVVANHWSTGGVSYFFAAGQVGIPANSSVSGSVTWSNLTNDDNSGPVTWTVVLNAG
jgi:hypothetical protein